MTSYTKLPFNVSKLAALELYFPFFCASLLSSACLATGKKVVHIWLSGELFTYALLFLFMQIIMMAVLMFQLKMVILCSTWHAYMVIFLVCRLKLFYCYFPLFSLFVANCVHLISYCWNVELAWNAKMKKVLFLFTMLVLEECILGHTIALCL